MSRRIELPALTRVEMSLQLGSLLGAAPDEDLVERVFARSEGYPLFVEELVAASADGRGPLPSTLRDALMARVERLPAAAQACSPRSRSDSGSMRNCWPKSPAWTRPTKDGQRPRVPDPGQARCQEPY